jgi:CheY-like chemotaxis protein
LQARIIDDLLDMSRILSGKLRVDIEVVSLPPIVEAVIDAEAPAARTKGILLHSVMEPLRSSIHGDPHRLHQIVRNLLSNAIKFTPEGGRVQIALRQVDSDVEIEVSDSGIGISPEFLPHVFDRFRQVDSSPSRKHGGLGLGLAIAKHLVELHGGSIRAASDGIGQGATFTISLPVAVERSLGAETGVTPRRNISPLSSPPDLTGRRILVVDDDPDTREAIKRILEDAGASVFLAESADEAARFILTASPAVLVCDIGLPGKDGYQFIAELRRHGFRGAAIAVTAFARSEDRTRALAAGYDMHLGKPFEPAELLAALATLCELGVQT